MNEDWYTSGPEGQKGPISLQKLRETLATHPQAEHVFIWHERLPDWVRAGEIPGIFTRDEPASDTPERAVATKRGPAAGGLLFGTLVLVLGCSLLYLGLSGAVTRMASALGMTRELVDASPGALLFIVGLIVIWTTRYRVSVK
jgi:uncharacterized protein DUF4339